MQISRREFGIIVAGPLLMPACAQKLSTAPTSARLEPWGEEVSGLNNTKAVLVYHGYSDDGNEKLFDALRRHGLNPRPRAGQLYGNTSYEVGADMTQFGWTFLVQNQRISEVGAVTLEHNHLWAAYRKLSVG